jgi:hypothetical protein
MKKLLLLMVGLTCAAMHPAVADQSCFMTKVQDSSGATLSLITGQGYLVTPGGDRVTAGQWRPLEKVQVCRGNGSSSVITNISHDPHETITAIKKNR